MSKRSDRPYRGGRSKDWIEVKSRQHHAFNRVMGPRREQSKYVDRLENFRSDLDDAAICNSQVARRRKREIEDAITNEWATVGDANDD